jgi:hypothetical protein
MSRVLTILIALSILGFIVAVLEAIFKFSIFRTGPEGYSHACANLALIAIALAVCFKKDSPESK